MKSEMLLFSVDCREICIKPLIRGPVPNIGDEVTIHEDGYDGKWKMIGLNQLGEWVLRKQTSCNPTPPMS